MNCPDCKHPVEAHGFSYCNRTGCTCNQGQPLAIAKAERDIARKQLIIARESMTDSVNRLLGLRDEELVKDISIFKRCAMRIYSDIKQAQIDIDNLEKENA